VVLPRNRQMLYSMCNFIIDRIGYSELILKVEKKDKTPISLHYALARWGETPFMKIIDV